MDAEINQEGYQDAKSQKNEHPAGAHCTHQRRISLAGERAMRNLQQGNAGEDRRRSQVHNSLEDVNPEHSGNWQIFLAGDQQRADRFAGAAEKKQAGKTHDRGGINRGKTAFAQIAGKALPAHSANGVGGVDGDEGEEQERQIGVAQGGAEKPPMESFEADGIAKLVEQRGKSDDREKGHGKLAERSAHPSRTVAVSLAECQGGFAGGVPWRKTSSTPFRGSPKISSDKLMFAHLATTENDNIGRLNRNAHAATVENRDSAIHSIAEGTRNRRNAAAQSSHPYQFGARVHIG